MQKKTIRFSHASTDCCFRGRFSDLKKLADLRRSVIITDEHVFRLHPRKFTGWNCIILKSGEKYKAQATADAVIGQLLLMEADRYCTLVGVGGGVVTDLTGYVGSIYLRGVRTGFVPTTLLGMVDAAVGGKNGVNVNDYKNLVGTIRQPAFILYDVDFLATLPEAEWRNGFAEIIKHACIANSRLFRLLESGGPESFRGRELETLIERNALFKAALVKQDEFESGPRKLLNFGHTLGHALEHRFELSHGQAISIGMSCASHISEALTGFRGTGRVVNLLQAYGLPAFASFDPEVLVAALQKDKKRRGRDIDFVLLEKIGKAVIKPVPVKRLVRILKTVVA